MTDRFDAIVIGAGQAGPSLAGRLTAAGMTVAMIERKLFGGTCVNTGCTPTKALVASAYAAHLARRAADFGVHTSAVTIDMAAVKARKERILRASRDSVENWLRTMERCTVVDGQARFTAPDTVKAGDRILSAPRIFINVGGRARIPAIPGIERINILTNTTILELDTLPDHLIIIGGSYIGLEFAQIYRRFGAKVTVIEMAPRLIAHEDEDVSEAIKDILEGEGIKIHTSAECLRFEASGDAIVTYIKASGGEMDITGSHLLMAVGRQPNTDDLGLEAAGVATDGRGFIVVDDELRTNVKGIWALGDCNGRGAFTHTSYNDFEIVAANLLNGGGRKVSDRIPGYALYTDPPLGRAGLSESEARSAGHKTRIGFRPMTRVARAIEKGETLGFMKIVVDAETNQILGAAILGVGGDEAVHGILDVMNAKAPFTTLQHAVPIHPTVSELIPTVLGELNPG